MKKLALIFSFIVCSVVFANAQTPVTNNDTKDKPVPAAITPAAPAQVVTPQSADLEVTKTEAVKNEPVKEKSCSKSKENCNKGKDCCKKEKATQGAGGGCCKKDKASCHKEKEEAKAAPATPATPAPATEPIKVPGDN